MSWLSRWTAQARFHNLFDATDSSDHLNQLPYKHTGVVYLKAALKHIFQKTNSTLTNLKQW